MGWKASHFYLKVYMGGKNTDFDALFGIDEWVSICGSAISESSTAMPALMVEGISTKFPGFSGRCPGIHKYKRPRTALVLWHHLKIKTQTNRLQRLVHHPFTGQKKRGKKQNTNFCINNVLTKPDPAQQRLQSESRPVQI